jgi:hypothetical protein
MPSESDGLRRLLARHPPPRLAEDFTEGLMRRVQQDEHARRQQHSLGKRLVLAAYWLAVLSASAAILSQRPLPEWATALLWLIALVLVPAGYAIVLWSSMGALANRERG